jgi:hypothetical protein
MWLRDHFTVRTAIWHLALGAMLIFSGCTTTAPPPSGPGAASETNLSPWLRGAATVRYSGQLLYFHCTSDHGNFWTWALTPAGDEDATEVDIRACPKAMRLEHQTVRITGRLIAREPRHFPIVVATKIEQADHENVVMQPVRMNQP